MNLISQANQARTYYRPIFLQNICAFWWLARSLRFARPAQFDILVAFGSRLGNKWLDETMVKGNPDVERSALLLYRLIRKIAAWDQLVEPFGGLAETVKLHKRLSGILKV